MTVTHPDRLSGIPARAVTLEARSTHTYTLSTARASA